MELTDIASLEKWVEIEKKAFKKFGLQSSVFNKKGVRITDAKDWTNAVCPEIKSTKKGQAFICATAHMNLSNQAEKTRQHVIEECDAGLTKIVIPIYIDDEYLGVIGGCGMLNPEGEFDSFAVNKITGIDADKIEALSDSVPVISEESIQKACLFFKGQVDELIRRSKDA